MSQCCQGKRRATLIVRLLALTLMLSACSMAELEKIATENAAPDGARPGGYGPLPAIVKERVYVPEEIITGGKQEFGGVSGQFTRMLVGDGQDVRLQKPVAVGGQGEYLFIVDAELRTVFRYHLTDKTLETIGDVSIRFAGEPGSIYVAADLSFYIVDSVGKQVFHFANDGSLLTTFQDAVNLSRPLDVFADEATGEVHVADGSYSHIVVFNQFGKAIRAYGQRGTGPGRFRAITGIANSVEGVVIIDRLELPIQMLSKTGDFKYSMGEGLQIYPSAVAINNRQWIIVADRADSMIRVYKDRQLMDTLGGVGAAPGRFREITSLWASNDLLYVADSMNRRVQVLRLEPNNLHQPAVAQ